MAQLRQAGQDGRPAHTALIDHRAEFYDGEPQLVDSVLDFLRPALTDGCAVIVATKPHLAAFTRALERSGDGSPGGQLPGGRLPGGGLHGGRLLTVDADDALQRLLIGDAPDPATFHAVVGDLLSSAARSGGPVRVYGEMVATLWRQGRVHAAMQLEDLWNEAAVRQPFGLLCGYPSALFVHPATLKVFSSVCRQHTEVMVSACQELAGWAPDAAGGLPELCGARWRLPAALSSGGRARRHVRELLLAWDLEELVDVAELLTTELVNNAVLHARSQVRLCVRQRAGALRVEVTDSGLGRLQRVDARPHDTSGRGVMLVEAMSSAWGTWMGEGHKTVWFELHTEAAAWIAS